MALLQLCVLASFRMGMSGSASFQSVRKSLNAASARTRAASASAPSEVLTRPSTIARNIADVLSLLRQTSDEIGISERPAWIDQRVCFRALYFGGVLYEEGRFV